MVIASGFKCMVKFNHPDYADAQIICEFIDIGKCIRAFRENCDLDDHAWEFIKISVSFIPCYR